MLPGHTILISKDGTELLISGKGTPIRDKESNIVGTALVFRDITEQEHMLKEVLKADKLESVGILAGGIAHDFNNILTAILGNISLAKMDADPRSEIYHLITEAESASIRAKDLTQQLLTFSKGGAPIKKILRWRHYLKTGSVLCSEVQMLNGVSKFGMIFGTPK